MKKLFTLMLVFSITTISAQKLKVAQGDFDFIQGQKEINVAFDYSSMQLMKENYTNEEYVSKRSGELEEKAKGKGETWKKSWKASPELIWNPKFLELVNKYLGKEKDIYFAENLTDAKYTLIVKIVWLYPWWDAGIMKQPAKVTTNLTFVETANKDNVLLEVNSTNAPGDQWGNNFSNESRIGEGFAKTGKSFAKMILKKGY